MGKAAGFLLDVFSYLAALPFIVFILVWILYYFWQQDKKLATMRSMDITMVFLIAAVAGMLDQLVNLGFGSIWILILIFILAFGLLGNAQQRLKGRIDAVKSLRVIWRLGFLILSFMYVVLLFIGILTYTMA
jgi:hypothetical protein